jgi:hypothetical protein
MEEKFCQAWRCAREQAQELGIRLRPLREDMLAAARKMLSGTRESDGFSQLAEKGRLDLSLEALAVKKPFTGLFTDTEANNALDRLLSAGYRF